MMNITGVSVTDFGIVNQIQYSLGKSEITDKLCGKFIQLFKLSKILEKSYACTNADAFKDLFLIKYAEIFNYVQEEIEKVASLDDSQVKTYFERVIKSTDDMIKYFHNDTKTIEHFTNVKKGLLSLSSSDFKKIITETLFSRFVSDQFTDSQLSLMLSEMNEQRIALAMSLDVDEEMNRLIEANVFKDIYRSDFSAQDNGILSVAVCDIDRNGLNSNYAVMVDVHNMAFNIATKYWRDNNFGDSQTKKSI